MNTVAFHTLGCKVNTYESEAMLQLFLKADYQVVDFKDKADVYVINTCTVTNTGDSKSRQMIRKAIRKNKDAIVCVAGCYAQVAPLEIAKIEGVDVIIGTQHRNQIVDFVNQAKIEKKLINKVETLERKIGFEDLDVPVFTENTRAFLKIQDGCNNYCTYCIIPYARGNIRSRDRFDVLKQARQLVENGFIEIVLTGIHTAGYGSEFTDYNFSNLLEDLINKVDGLKRLRISSIEFSQIDEKIINLIEDNSIIVDHLHIPLQAGSDEILKKMNRKYTTEEYKEKIDTIRSRLPNIAISTDVIVGFPYETEELFNASLAFINSIGFSGVHAFPYSKRGNTPASNMKEQIDELEKSRRVKALLMLAEDMKKDYINSNFGIDLEVLVEEEKNGYLVGYTSNYIRVKFLGDASLLGKIEKVRLMKNKGKEVLGELV